MPGDEGYAQTEDYPPRETGLIGSLAVSFLRVGLFAFGGGASVIPVLRAELVDRRSWFTAEEFLDIYTLGSTLPGPVGSNLAAYVGWRLAGWPGALVAFGSSVLPVAAAMILLATLYATYRDNPLVEGFLTGVRPVVVAMLAAVVWEFLKPALGRVGDGWRFVAKAILIAVMVALGLWLGVGAAWLIVIGGVTGLVLFR